MNKEQIESAARDEVKAVEMYCMGNQEKDLVRNSFIKGAEWMEQQLEPQWIDVTKELPKEGNRYWCYVTALSDLGWEHFQWNCYYDPQNKEFRDAGKIYPVTHWTNLLPPPKDK